MKTSELRIGNCIKYGNNPCIVKGINTDNFISCVWNNKDSIIWGEPVMDFEPFPLSEECLLEFGYEDWGVVISNEHESYKRFVLHNFVDGTSNHEVHIITSTYGNTHHVEYVTSIDEDERQYNGRMEFVHDLQNAVYKETNIELVHND